MEKVDAFCPASNFSWMPSPFLSVLASLTLSLLTVSPFSFFSVPKAPSIFS